MICAMVTSSPADAVVVSDLVKQIGPILHGHNPAVQSAVLADLLATWLAGHMSSDPGKFREELLADHIKLVRKLIPVNEKMIVARVRAESN